MDIFKRASKQKLRIQTDRGLLSVEQLWDLPLEELDRLAVALEKEHKESGGKSFLEKKNKKDATAKLRFQIVLEILESKAKDAETAQKAAETKARNQRILELIAEKEDGQLAEKSIEELKAMLAD